MAVSTDPTVLANNARCYESCIPDGMQMSVLISLFAQIANVSVDTNSLMNNAKCIDSCVPRGMQLPVLIYLATQIANNGGGGGGGGNVLLGDPTAGATINGGVAYDALGNVWGDFDPAGVHDWQKLISAQAAMKVIAAAQRNEPMIVIAPELPASPDMPPVKLPPSRRSKVFAFLHTIKMFLMSFFALLMLFVPFTAIAAAPPIVHSPLTEKFATGVPAAGDAPIFNADNTWHFAAGGGGITSLNGAITGTGPGATTTLLGSFTALQLFNAVATKTGTGLPMFNNSPTMIGAIVFGALSTEMDQGGIQSFSINDRTAQNSAGATVFDWIGGLSDHTLTPNRAVVTDGSSPPLFFSSATTDTQIGFLSAVTSDVQVQLNAKAPLVSPTFTGTAAFNGEVDLKGTTNFIAGNVRLAGGIYSATNMTATVDFNAAPRSWTNVNSDFTLPLFLGVDGTKTMSQVQILHITNSTPASPRAVTIPNPLRGWWYGTNATVFYVTNDCSVYAEQYGGAFTNIAVAFNR